MNLYAYCDNNPVMYVDPSGYCGQKNAVRGTEPPITEPAKLLEAKPTRKQLAEEKLRQSLESSKRDPSEAPDFIFGGRNYDKEGRVIGEGTVVPWNTGYKTFEELKKHLPIAPKGYAWHHIIEQNKTNMGKYLPEFIHNKQNIVLLDNRKGKIHRRVTGYYNSKDTNLLLEGRVRDYVNQLSSKEQFEFGIDTLNVYNANKKMKWDSKKKLWVFE